VAVATEGEEPIAAQAAEEDIADDAELDSDLDDDDNSVGSSDDDYDGDSDDDEAPDLDRVLAETPSNGLALRREIERRLEERRLAKDLDDLDFDLD
jgi:hypothetical protein